MDYFLQVFSLECTRPHAWCLSACLPVACLPACLPTYLPACLPACLPTCLLAYLLTWALLELIFNVLLNKVTNALTTSWHLGLLSEPNISSLLSELCTLHTPYCRHNAGGRGGSASYYCLCFQLGVIICYAVSPSAVSSLFINNITHILAQSVPHRGQTKPAPHHDERQMIVIKTCYIMFFESLDFNLCDYSDVLKLYD